MKKLSEFEKVLFRVARNEIPKLTQDEFRRAIRKCIKEHRANEKRSGLRGMSSVINVSGLLPYHIKRAHKSMVV